MIISCHLVGDLGPFKGCYWVTSTERSFTPRSKKKLETSKHPLKRDSDIFFESIEGWSKKQGKTLKQTSDHQSNKSIRSKQNHTWYTRRRADVIRLQNPTEDNRAFWRMLTSANRVVLVVKTKMADISLVSRVRTRLNNSWKHGKNSKKTTWRAKSAIWRIFEGLNNPKCALWVYQRWT